VEHIALREEPYSSTPTINEVGEAIRILSNYYTNIKALSKRAMREGIDVDPALLLDLRIGISNLNSQRVRAVHRKLEKQIVL